MRKAAAAKEATMVKWKRQGQCCRRGEGRGQCNQMAQNLQKLHKHTHAHTARKDTCGTCSNSSNGNGNLQRTRKSLPGGSQAVQAAPCGRVPCVDFSLLRPSTVASSKPTAAAAAAGRRQDEEVEEELAVTLPTVSTAAPALPLLLLLACSCIPSPTAPLLLSSWQWHSGFAAFVLPR